MDTIHTNIYFASFVYVCVCTYPLDGFFRGIFFSGALLVFLLQFLQWFASWNVVWYWFTYLGMLVRCVTKILKQTCTYIGQVLGFAGVIKNFETDMYIYRLGFRFCRCDLGDGRWSTLDLIPLILFDGDGADQGLKQLKVSDGSLKFYILAKLFQWEKMTFVVLCTMRFMFAIVKLFILT